MSYCIAKSIVLKQNEIIVKGGDNNVVPRDEYTIRIPRTPGDERTFVRELIGGSIHPTSSCGNYFWKWIAGKLCARYNYDSTERELDAAFAMLEDEYNIRKKAPSAIIAFTDCPNTYLRKDKYGARRTEYKENASVFNLYQAEYLAGRYNYTKGERIIN